MKLICDYVIHEDICNLECNYCLIEKRNDINTLSESVFDILASIRENLNPAVLKISGGEITYFGDDFIQLCKVASKMFSRIQILTNGTILTEEWIYELSEMKNIHFQFSLDGHTSKMNSNRFTNQNLINKCLKNIEIASWFNPVELNLVLTKINASTLFDFIKIIGGINENIVIFPFPVRDWPNMLPHWKCIPNLLNNLDKDPIYWENVPPRVYFEDIIQFLSKFKRVFPCRIPYLINGVYDSKEVDLCPCGGGLNINRMIDEIGKDELNTIHIQKKINKGILTKKCRTCFTHYEIINEYLFGRITKQEFNRIPIFKGLNLDSSIESLMKMLNEN